ncbi:ElyC/SanA/YdcF family protein [Verrucomicrobiales bacterium BCK34]|nr:ElyC/SanA/YdcF family protein [Verrucomicrobiales bacterium BCK34]
MRIFRIYHRRLTYLSLAGTFLLLLTVFVCDRLVTRASEGRHTDDLSAVKKMTVAIVPGCSEYLRDGRRNLYFIYRIDAAVELYEASKCQWIIVSGDNGNKSYNEPERMKAALIARGIPEEKIVCDFAGFRTLDTIARARAVFQLEEAVIISQEFHNQRALFLASHFGLNAVGYDAREVGYAGGLKTRLREKLARVKTVLDVHVLGTGPRFYGDPLPICQTH